jgi:prepilin-type N-terminal cleavage/methylation domain-containing protein
MKKTLRPALKIKTQQGFTLIELMVAMTIFLIIGAAAMSLFRQHASLFTTQQGEVGLNMGLRNALQQIQTDAVQAGNGFYNGGATQTSNTPAGVSVQNAAGAFDTVFFIQATTPAVPLNGAGCMLTTSGSATLAAGSGVPASQFSGYVMFINNDNTQMTVAKLTTATAGAGGVINLTYTPTNANGTNSSANDPTLLTATANPASPPPGSQLLSNQFCASNGDLVVGLSWVKYSVNALNQLVRDTSSGAVGDIIADNILGFKVGAATYQNGAGVSTSTPSYSFCASCPSPTGYSNIFTLIRSVRVSLIGRTPPGQFTGQSFRNSYDGGQYRIQALSLVINPRNLSMND